MEGPHKIPDNKPQHGRRNKIGQRFKEGWEALTLSGGYKRGFGGLGLPTLLLRFKYSGLNDETKKNLDNQILHK